MSYIVTLYFCLANILKMLYLALAMHICELIHGLKYKKTKNKNKNKKTQNQHLTENSLICLRRSGI